MKVKVAKDQRTKLFLVNIFCLADEFESVLCSDVQLSFVERLKANSTLPNGEIVCINNSQRILSESSLQLCYPGEKNKLIVYLKFSSDLCAEEIELIQNLIADKFDQMPSFEGSVIEFKNGWRAVLSFRPDLL